MKKISILSLHMGYGGIEKSIVALANLLSDDYEIEIACSYKLYDEPVFPLNKKIKVTYLMEDMRPNRDEFISAVKRKRITRIFKEGILGVKVLKMRKKTMVNYIKNCDSDICIATRDIFDEWLGMYGRSDMLKIGWEHNHYHNDMKYASNVTRSSSNLDYLVLVSNSLKDFYSRELRKSKCKCLYIPNIIDKMPRSGAKLESNKLISVGRLSPEKGYMDLLKLFNLMSKDHPKWTLDIIGDGVEMPKLKSYIERHKLNDKVCLHGFRNKDYIDKMLDEASLYVMTSYTESFGIVLIEAMSHGVPCIAFSSAEGARELINSGSNGYLIKNRNFAAMIKKIEDLMSKKEERKRIGEASRIEARKYTGAVVKEQWIDLLEEKW